MRALHPKIEASRRTFLHDTGLFHLRVGSGDDVAMLASRNVSHVHTHVSKMQLCVCMVYIKFSMYCTTVGVNNGIFRTSTSAVENVIQ